MARGAQRETITRMLEQAGLPIAEADKLAREVIAKSIIEHANKLQLELTMDDKTQELLAAIERLNLNLERIFPLVEARKREAEARAEEAERVLRDMDERR